MTPHPNQHLNFANPAVESSAESSAPPNVSHFCGLKSSSIKVWGSKTSWIEALESQTSSQVKFAARKNNYFSVKAKIKLLCRRTSLPKNMKHLVGRQAPNIFCREYFSSLSLSLSFSPLFFPPNELVPFICCCCCSCYFHIHPFDNFHLSKQKNRNESSSSWTEIRRRGRILLFSCFCCFCCGFQKHHHITICTVPC